MSVTYRPKMVDNEASYPEYPVIHFESWFNNTVKGKSGQITTSHKVIVIVWFSLPSSV